MAIAATAVWRVRPTGQGGDDTNGAGFDPAIAGAGTDYTQQAAAQLALTDLATSAANSTTLTSATGGFTAAMVGNAIRIRSGTNFVVGYYFITACTNANTVTLDRTPATAGAGSAGAGNLGGAAATLERVATNGNAVGDKIVPGNTVYMRGSGSDTPTVADYSPTGYFTPVSGTATQGIKILAENGRPRVEPPGCWISTGSYITIDGFYFYATGSSGGTSGFVRPTSGTVSNCVFDTNTQAMIGVYLSSGRIFNCEIKGDPSVAKNTNAAIYLTSYGSMAIGNFIHDWAGYGVQMFYLSDVVNNVISRCKNHSAVISGSAINYGMLFMYNTLDSGGADGINFADANWLVANVVGNIISNHVGVGAAGIRLFSGTLNDNQTVAHWHDHNNFYNNTANYAANTPAGPNDTYLDPQYGNAAANDYRVGVNMKGINFPGVFMHNPNVVSYLDMGALQRQEPAGGGGGGTGAGAGTGAVILV